MAEADIGLQWNSQGLDRETIAAYRRLYHIEDYAAAGIHPDGQVVVATPEFDDMPRLLDGVLLPAIMN